jgi:hypothetical protein
MPTLDVREINIVIAILGMLINISKVAAANHRCRRFHCLLWLPFSQDQASVVFGRSLYALSYLDLPNISSSCLVPAVLVGIILGPIASRFLDAERLDPPRTDNKKPLLW